ncbi:4-oxalocrotonate tautomerase [Rugamonas sp. DEMB1]|jgi:hypothetical protein|uniref:4-oxalocrotonate tautomerase n=1 Tax=Rugamonas sp. DEMB1 TaxID=3039386 RepID=UPI00244BD4BA|nr:4-oxalocrotonate tautomerase [Rugamonas sp. DEMB1]WGG50934.1 4-oxalocrotonate tautomerase [Rugamonas sp. DEMB1]
MPLTLTLTEGVLPLGTEKLAVAQITDAFLKHHGLTGNETMRANITANVHVLPRDATFSGGRNFAGAWVEWKVPSFALAERKVQQGFFAEATSIIHDLSGGVQPKEHIYVNVVHAVDGGWNFNGQAMTNGEIVAEITKG